MVQACPFHKPTDVPTFDVDFYSDEVIRDPYPYYAAMRALGPVVYLPSLGNYAVTRYAEARQVLHDWKSFSSENAIAADAAGCTFFHGASNLVTDPPVHDVIRAKMAAPLLPRALEGARENIERQADELIERLTRQRAFDGMVDLARHLPITLVTELVGLPDDGRENMLDWAAAAFNITGIQNERGRKGAETLVEMRDWIVTKATPDRLKPGSLTARIRDMVATGEIPEALFLGIMNDYITPSLDTTISATGTLLYQLGRNPDQWEILKNDPSLIDSAINEAVRIGSPIRSFTRRVTTPCSLGGVSLPAQALVMVLYASANRDERKFPEPDRFDVRRAAVDHVGFGHGIHMCVGMHLAKLEMAALLKSMIARVEFIEVGQPSIALNNTIHAFASLPVTFTARALRTKTPEMTAASTLVADDDAWLSAQIAARSPEGDGIVSLELVSPHGATFPIFTAGSHIDVRLANGLVRQYSLSNDPSVPHMYRIAVLRETASRGGSAAVHDELTVGKTVHIGRPRNLFSLNETAPASVLMAGGIGITPIMSMAYRLHALGRPMSLHYASRSRSRAAYLNELQNAPFAANVSCYFDEDADENAIARKMDVRAVLRDSAAGAHLYCCGPKGFIEYVTTAARELDWREDRIHVEHFSATPLLEGAPFDVVAARSGMTLHVPCDKTILEVLTDAGINVPSSCHSGVCSTCMTGVIDGIPEHRDMVLSAEERNENRLITVCCSRSKTRQLVLDI
ncbi:MAG: cytochrome P450/oxidoreductase [Janthinobacterium lividum]